MWLPQHIEADVVFVSLYLHFKDLLLCLVQFTRSLEKLFFQHSLCGRRFLLSCSHPGSCSSSRKQLCGCFMSVSSCCRASTRLWVVLSVFPNLVTTFLTCEVVIGVNEQSGTRNVGKSAQHCPNDPPRRCSGE